MADNGKRRKRTIIIGGLVVLTVLVSLKWCTNDQPEEPTVQPAETRKEAPADTLQTDTLSETEPEPYTPWHPSVRRRRHRKIAAVVKQDTEEVPSIVPEKPSPAPAPEWQEKRPEQEKEEPEKPARSTAPRYTFPREHQFRAGVRIGLGCSKIGGLGNILESYDIRPQFTMEEKGRIVPRIGVFATWQYSRIGAEFGVDYTRLSTKVTECKKPLDPTQQEQARGVTETTSFHYNFITPQLLLRFYATPKIYMGAGIGAAIPFGSRNVDFTDDRGGVVYGQKAERTQDHLRETLKARVHLMPVIKIGYADPKSGLEAALEYSFGTNDLLRTRENDYGYQEHMNSAQYVGVTVGYSLPLNKKGEKGK